MRPTAAPLVPPAPAAVPAVPGRTAVAQEQATVANDERYAADIAFGRAMARLRNAQEARARAVRTQTDVEQARAEERAAQEALREARAMRNRASAGQFRAQQELEQAALVEAYGPDGPTLPQQLALRGQQAAGFVAGVARDTLPAAGQTIIEHGRHAYAAVSDPIATAQSLIARPTAEQRDEGLVAAAERERQAAEARQAASLRLPSEPFAVGTEVGSRVATEFTGPLLGDSLLMGAVGRLAGGLRMPRGSHAPTEPVAPAPRIAGEPTVAPRAPAEPAPASTPRASGEPSPASAAGEPAGGAPSAPPRPQDVVAAMEAERAQAIARTGAGDGAWRSAVNEHTPFVRVISEEELGSLIGRGRVVNRGTTQRTFTDPDAGHRWAVNHLFDEAPDGSLQRVTSMAPTSAFGAAPVMPVSAWAPAQTGYAESLVQLNSTGGSAGYLVRFRQNVPRIASGNQAITETEYFIPGGYRLDQIEWIADVRTNRWLYGSPGAAGTAEELAALRAQMPTASQGAPTRPPVAPELRPAFDLRQQYRALLQRARQLGDASLQAEVHEFGRELARELRQIVGTVDFENGVPRYVGGARRSGNFDYDGVMERLTALQARIEALRGRMP